VELAVRPSISVIIPTHNRPDTLTEALRSVALQTIDLGRVEVIVVNDGGADVATQVQAASGGLVVRVHTLYPARGPAGARNVGIDLARGEYIAFLDDDDVYLPDHLRTLLDALEADDLEAAYTNCLVSAVRIDPALPVSGGQHLLDLPFSSDLLSVCPHIAIHSPLFRTFRARGARFDTTLAGLTDWDLQLQLVHDHGYRLRYLDEVTVVYHRVPLMRSITGQIAQDPATQARFVRHVWRVWKKWPAPNEKVARYRRQLMEGVLLGVKRAPDGPLPLSYYDRCVRLLASAWHGREAEQGLVDRLAAAASASAV
jgi:glycosyltransferase involved in cell wall biosynthesis